ncbi:MAG: hypothetical protein K2P85_06355 [Flavobacteriaceae bacterium]|nr:hypothetical protein [Flavobacteriaceae bacterium]
MENQKNLELNEQAIDALRVSAKWSMFLAIMGFVGIVFMIFGAIFMSSVMSMIPQTPGPFGNLRGFISIFYIAMAALYFAPIYYLYKYASDMKNALLSSSSDLVATALGYLKSHHKYLGVSIIILISLYFLMVVGMIVFFASSAMSGSKF